MFGRPLLACLHAVSLLGATAVLVQAASAEPSVHVVHTQAMPPNPQPPDFVIEVAVQAAADQLGVTADNLVVVASEQRDWPDTSLGCPQPGRAYAQIVTPGYLITIDTADGATEVQVHTNPDASVSA